MKRKGRLLVYPVPCSWDWSMPATWTAQRLLQLDGAASCCRLTDRITLLLQTKIIKSWWAIRGWAAMRWCCTRFALMTKSWRFGRTRHTALTRSCIRGQALASQTPAGTGPSAKRMTVWLIWSQGLAQLQKHRSWQKQHLNKMGMGHGKGWDLPGRRWH